MISVSLRRRDDLVSDPDYATLDDLSDDSAAIREGFLEALLFACELARAIAGVEVLHSNGNVTLRSGILGR